METRAAEEVRLTLSPKEYEKKKKKQTNIHKLNTRLNAKKKTLNKIDENSHLKMYMLMIWPYAFLPSATELKATENQFHRKMQQIPLTATKTYAKVLTEQMKTTS